MGGEAPLQCHQQCGVPTGPAMASEGPEGRGTSCDVTSSSFGASPKDREPTSPPNEGKELWRKEEPTHCLCGPLQLQGPLPGSQGYPPWPTPAPGVPLTPGRLHSILAEPPPSTSLRACKGRKKQKSMRIPRK